MKSNKCAKNIDETADTMIKIIEAPSSRTARNLQRRV